MNWYLCKTKILGRVNVRAEKLGVGSKELGKLSGNRSTLTLGIFLSKIGSIKHHQ
jgi:hypothetical protein